MENGLNEYVVHSENPQYNAETMKIRDGYYMIIAGDDSIKAYLGVSIWHEIGGTELRWYSSFFDNTDGGWLEITLNDSSNNLTPFVKRAIDANNIKAAKWIAERAIELHPETELEIKALIEISSKNQPELKEKIVSSQVSAVFENATTGERSLVLDPNHPSYEEDKRYAKSLGYVVLGPEFLDSF